MSARTDSILAIASAILVLFTAMLDPRLSSGLAVGLLIGYAVYKIVIGRTQPSKP